MLIDRPDQLLARHVTPELSNAELLPHVLDARRRPRRTWRLARSNARPRRTMASLWSPKRGRPRDFVTKALEAQTM